MVYGCRKPPGAVLVALFCAGCGGGGSDPDFQAARLAVKASTGLKFPIFQTLERHHLVGVKGSQADVVCGDLWSQGPWDTADVTPFIYVWKLKPAVPYVGRREGEVVIVRTLGRREVAELGLFCGWADRPQPNEWNYFN